MLRTRTSMARISRPFALGLSRLEDRITPIATTWIGGTVGQTNVWEVGTNWSAGVPGLLDTAVFQGTGNKNTAPVLSAATTIEGLSIAATWPGSIAFNQNIILTGTSTWNAGSLSIGAAAMVSNTGTLTVGNAAVVSLVGGGKLSNAGTMIQSGTANLQISNSGTTLDTPVGGIYDLQSDVAITFTGTAGNFTNAGTLRRTVGTNTGTLVGNFSLNGTVDVQTGTLSLSPSGAAGSVAGVTFKVQPAATVNLAGGSDVAYSGALSATGGGTLLHNGGTMTFAGDATYSFASPMYQWTAGTLNLNGKTLTNAMGSTVTMSNPGSISLVGTGTLTNKGTIVHSGSGNLLVSNTGTVLDNAVGGLYDFQSDAAITFTGNSGSFTSEGTLRRSVGTGTAQIASHFSITGSVEVQTGTLSFAPSGTVGTVTDTTATVAKNATLNTTGSSAVSYFGKLTGSGAGTVAMSGGTLAVPTTAAFSFPDGMFQWTAGTISVTGTLTNSAGSFLTLSNAGTVTLLGSGTLTNAGTIRQTGAGNLNLNNTGTALNTPVGGIYDLQSDAAISFSGNPGSFTVGGTLRRSVAAGTATLVSNFSLTGTVDVQSGTLSLSPSGATGSVSGVTLKVASGSTLNLAGGSVVNYSGSLNASGGGTLAHVGGTVVIAADTTYNFPAAMYQWVTGTLNLNGKTLTNAVGSVMTLSNGGNVSLLGDGTLTNKGTINQTGAGNLLISNTATLLDNAAGGLYDLQSDETAITYSGNPGTFASKGTLRRSVGTKVASMVGNFTISNIVDIKSGALSFTPSGATGNVSDATISVAAGAALNPTGGSVVSYSGSIVGNGAGTIAMSGGTLSVPTGAVFSFPDPMFQWSAGSINVAAGKTLINASKHSMTLSNPGNVSLLGGGTLSNIGTIRQTGAGNLLISNSGTTLASTVGGVYDMQTPAEITFSGASGSFTNLGTLRRSTAAGTASIRTHFSLTGTVDVQVGTLSLAPSATTGTVSGATLNANVGAALNLAGGSTVNYEGAITGSGGGTLALAGGTLAVANDASFNFPNPMFQWTSGNINIASTKTLTNVAGGFMTLSNAGNVFLLGSGTLSNAGTIRQAGAGTLMISNSGTLLSNASTGLYEIAADNDISFTGASGAFDNKGTLRRSGGTGVSNFFPIFTNSGGIIDVQVGTLDLPGTINLNGGTIQGSGTLLAPVINSDGFTRPGNSPGLLTITGGYTQNKTGTFIMEVDGTTPGTQYDQLKVNGTVTLGGGLSVVNSSSLAIGNTLTLIDNDGTDPVVGTFAGLTTGSSVGSSGGGQFLVIDYKGGTGNDVTLKVIPFFVIIEGGAAQRSMVRTMTVNFAEPISLAPNAFSITGTAPGGGAITGVTVNQSLGGGGKVATLTFSGVPVIGGSLPDGNLTMTIDGSKITVISNGQLLDADGDNNPGGTNGVALHRLFGDSDGDRDVDNADFVNFRLAFGGGTSIFNYDGDSDTDNSDFVEFRSRFGITLP